MFNEYHIEVENPLLCIVMWKMMEFAVGQRAVFCPACVLNPVLPLQNIADVEGNHLHPLGILYLMWARVLILNLKGLNLLP